MSERAVGRPWTASEDQLLANAVAVHGQVDNWKAVALSVPGRTNKACRKRWLHSLSPNVKKTAWTREEDDQLLELYKIHSAKWALIARSIPGRTDDACSKRYREALDPALKKDEWTPDEDEALIAAHSRLDGKWGRVGQELQRSGLGCRNRWRLLQRKRAAAATAQNFTLPALDMPYQWPVDYPAPFNYSSSSLSSALHPVREPTASVFAPFDYDDSVSSTYTDDMHAYTDRPHQFHQLQRSVPHTSSAHPVQVDHYAASVPHEEPSLSHAALSSSRRSLRPPEPYFTPSQLPDLQASHVSSSIPSVALLDKPDTYYHPSPDPQLDVNPQLPLLASPDPLSIPESQPGYHYPHQRDPSRARVVETLHGQEQHGEYHLNHVQPEQSPHTLSASRPPTTSSPDTRFALDRRTSSQPEAGPSRTTSDHYYSSNSLHPSQLVRRSTASPRAPSMPYAKRPSVDASSTSTDDRDPHTARSIPRQKVGAGSSKRSDAQTPLRLSSDLQATSDPAVKPYACGHESCWPPNATSSRACYCTSRGLSDHNKATHPDDSGGDRPYRCGLEGCGKSWKSINGLQYHLQISKAHFQHAITSSFLSAYICGLSVPASVEASTGQGEDQTKKQYKCPHENCPNRYKQLSGLRYHLAHGHPVELPKQLEFVPPALSRKLAEKMRVQGPSSERQTHDTGSEPSHRGSFT